MFAFRFSCWRPLCHTRQPIISYRSLNKGLPPLWSSPLDSAHLRNHQEQDPTITKRGYCVRKGHLLKQDVELALDQWGKHNKVNVTFPSSAIRSTQEVAHAFISMVQRALTSPKSRRPALISMVPRAMTSPKLKETGPYKSLRVSMIAQNPGFKFRKQCMHV
ncbi:hypothetical protein AMTR_s00076p00193910 [Amborella trichopoda]|uniref:Uncharacterized protein n=1 Tax=Amborella trichopoda TaxID=13333 RepID=W1PCH6_AMBTC|nr:hypothetical protein AMTR_s00076p00193910 [Amborella trichopoda]